MIEYKGRVESYSREMLRKESQIKELQGRIETGDGCEYLFQIHTLNYSVGIILFLLLDHEDRFRKFPNQKLPCLLSYQLSSNNVPSANSVPWLVNF